MKQKTTVQKYPHPIVGTIWRYKGKPVFITGGQYTGSYGGISNFWNFRTIEKDGTLGEEYGDYDNKNQFEFLAKPTRIEWE